MKGKGREWRGRGERRKEGRGLPDTPLLLYTVTVTRLKNCYHETSINETENYIRSFVGFIINQKCNCKCKSQQFLEMGMIAKY